MKPPITYIEYIDNIIYEFAQHPNIDEIRKLRSKYHKKKRSMPFFQYILQFYIRKSPEKIIFDYRSYRYLYTYIDKKYLCSKNGIMITSRAAEEWKAGLIVYIQDIDDATMIYPFTQTYFESNFRAVFDPETHIFIFHSKGKSSPQRGILNINTQTKFNIKKML